MNKDTVEFVLRDKVFVRVSSSFVPVVGQSVLIEGKAYRITRVSFDVDYSLRSLSCIAEVRVAK